MKSYYNNTIQLGQGVPMGDVLVNPQNLIVVETKQGFMVNRALSVSPVRDWQLRNFNKGRPGTATSRTHLGNGTGFNFKIPRSSEGGSNEDFEIFEIFENPGQTMWQVFWSMPRPMFDVQIWEDIPAGHGIKGQLDNQITNIFSETVRQPAGWMLRGRDSPRGAETDIGSWFQLPGMEVSFGLFNPASHPHVAAPQMFWKIRPIKHRALNPLPIFESEYLQRLNISEEKEEARAARDAAFILECLVDARRCIKWTAQKESFDWGSFNTVGVLPVTGFDGADARYSQAWLSDLAAPYYKNRAGNRRGARA